jgi:hypothetical protein
MAHQISAHEFPSPFFYLLATNPNPSLPVACSHTSISSLSLCISLTSFSLSTVYLHPFNSLTLPHFNITQNKQRKQQGFNVSVAARKRKQEERGGEGKDGEEEEDAAHALPLACPPANSDEPLFVSSSSWTLGPKPKGAKTPSPKGGKKGKNCRH